MEKHYLAGMDLMVIEFDVALLPNVHCVNRFLTN